MRIILLAACALALGDECRAEDPVSLLQLRARGGAAAGALAGAEAAAHSAWSRLASRAAALTSFVANPVIPVDDETAWMYRVAVYSVIAAVVLGGLLLWLWSYCRKSPEPETGIRADIARLKHQEVSLEQQLHDVRGHRSDLEDAVFAQDRPEELRGDPKGVNAAIDRYVESRAGAGLQKVRSLLKRRELLEDLLARKYEEEKQRFVAQGVDRVQAVAREVGGMLEVKDEDIAGLLTDTRPGKQLPPVAVVLAGLVAPVQLAFVVGLNRFLLFWHTALVVFDVLVLVHFPSQGCTSELGARSLGWEGLWISVHGCLHLAALLHRAWIEWLMGTTYTRLANRPLKPGLLGRWMGTWSFLFFTDIDNPRALYLVDYVQNSFTYNVASFLLVVDFLWNALGAASLWKAQAPCSEDHLDFFFLAVRVYSAFFGAFFLLNVALVVTWIITVCLWRGKSQVKLIRKARNFDAAYSPTGLPLCTLLLRTFVFRDSADRWHAEYQCLLGEKYIVEAEEAEVRLKLEALEREREQIERAEAQMRQTTAELYESEEEFTEAWFEGLNAAFGAQDPEGAAAGSDSLLVLLRQTQQEAEKALAEAKETELYKAAQKAGEDALVAARESRFVHLATEQAQSVLESDAVQDVVQKVTSQGQAVLESEGVQNVTAQVKQAASTVAESETFAAAKAAAKATAAKVLATPKASSRSAVDELRQEYDDPPAVSDPSPPEKAGKAGSRRGKS